MLNGILGVLTSHEYILLRGDAFSCFEMGVNYFGNYLFESFTQGTEKADWPIDVDCSRCFP